MSAALPIVQEKLSEPLHIHIDDFGTGYSSLAYLHKLPIDAVKIDRSFVQSSDTDQAAWQIVTSICSLAHNIGVSLIAEGIETLEQCQRLDDLGCRRLQGYLFGRPKPPQPRPRDHVDLDRNTFKTRPRSKTTQRP